MLGGVGSFTGQERHLRFAAPGAKGERRVVVVDGINWSKDGGQSEHKDKILNHMTSFLSISLKLFPSNFSLFYS